MKLAVISDVHGNYKALEAFLTYIETEQEKVEEIICLGDYITDSPYPERTMELLYDMRNRYPCHMVKGNREEYLITNHHRAQGWKPSSANGALYYTALHVTAKDIRFFESLPMTKLLEKAGYPLITLCHGSPSQIRGNLRRDRPLMQEVLRILPTPWLLGGHSHHQEVQQMFGRAYLNPGSLGLAIDDVGKRAQFAMLHGRDGEWEPELISIPYDVESFLQDFTASGLDSYGMILNRIPEEVWEQVAEQMEL